MTDLVLAVLVICDFFFLMPDKSLFERLVAKRIILRLFFFENRGSTT
jgi:hypothetical protein